MNINITDARLRHAADLREKIERLENEFKQLFAEEKPEDHPYASVLHKPKKGAWTPERRAKFRRTMRLKRKG